ncbi:MAG TPA: OFA family MFS transporter, partial [Vicinamibacterales bacterium]|nr:OFA family MFS transporter [Vicinamibacterales bacterium]
QVALGAVYAWSVFRIPLTRAFGWTISEVTLTFTIAIFVLGLAAFGGGLWMRRVGPRTVALTAGALYGAGVGLASLAGGRLWWLYCSYGLIAGVGLGLGYIVPVATLVKWFPDKRGLITGLAVAGFGAGALITAPVATHLIASVGVLRTFAILGAAYFVAVTGGALFMRNPPDGYQPPSARDGLKAVPYRMKVVGNGLQAVPSSTLGAALRSWQWYALWTLLFLNTTAGIAVISQAAPMFQEITHITAARAASVVGVISIANGAGRLLWAWLSDVIGRRPVFLAMFVVQAIVFWILPSAHSLTLFAALTVLVLLCYGGGFGTMPAFAADYFGAEHVGSIYGLMLTAWGVAGILGPTLMAALRERSGGYDGALRLIAALMLVSAVIPLLVRPPKAADVARPF